MGARVAKVLGAAICCLLIVSQQSDAFQTEDATYVGSDACLGCHNATTGPALGAPDVSHFTETLHSNQYRLPTVDTVIGDFDADPVEFTVGDATLTVSFDDNGGSGPWTMRLQGTSFDETMTIVRAHGGKAIDKNEDPVLPDQPGRRKWIGKQRYHVKIDNSYYILPGQWNPRPDRDGGNQGWVAYHPERWMDENGDWFVEKKRSEELNCFGCHQVGDGPTQNADGEWVLEEADNVSFWNPGCESCHGPGSEHMAAGGQGAIVNPADLTTSQQNDVCAACHIRPKGFAIGTEQPGYPYSETLERTFRPGDDLESFIQRDNAGYWPDGTSRQHHQQSLDYAQSAHSDIISCIACHTSHDEDSKEHQLKMTARDNSLCVQCHPSYADEETLVMHTKHPVDLAEGLGRCVDCHMPTMQKSGVNYDIHAHTFAVVLPQVTVDTQEDGGQPNSCAVSCHVDGTLGAPTFGVTGGTVGKWTDAADLQLAELLKPTDDTPPVVAGPADMATLVITLSNSGMPVSGATVSFSRSIAGRSPSYDWTGLTDSDGEVTIDIEAAANLLRKGVSGYYLAKAEDSSGTLLGQWASVTINGGKELAVSLPIGERASVTTVGEIEFALLPNYPNPFNPSTQIAYQVPQPSRVWLGIYNTLGQQVRVLVDQIQEPGPYSIQWDGRDETGQQVGSGIYISRLINKTNVASRRMMLVK